MGAALSVDDLEEVWERLARAPRFGPNRPPRITPALAGTAPTCPPGVAYAAFDGLFQQALLRHLSGAPGALDDLRAGARHLLARVVCAP